MNSIHAAKCFNLATVLALALAVPQAFAHTSPVEMTPAANSLVGAPPSVTIRFSEALEPKFSQITVTNAAGQVVNKETSVCSADKLTMSLVLPQLPPGIYTVHWAGVAADTHRSQGDYKFTVK